MDIIQTLDAEPAVLSPGLPEGASVVVWRRRGHDLEVLLLHASRSEVDKRQPAWAWGPPAGPRRPGEYVGFTAQRELREQTRLELKLTLAETGSADWRVFTAEAPTAAAVELDPAHDRFAWVPLDAALLHCAPQPVTDQLRLALAAAA